MKKPTREILRSGAAAQPALELTAPDRRIAAEKVFVTIFAWPGGGLAQSNNSLEPTIGLPSVDLDVHRSAAQLWCVRQRSRHLMNDALLRNFLREWIADEYAVTEIREFEYELDSWGQPIPHRDICRSSQESRLAGLQRAAPDRTDLHNMHRAALSALSELSSTDSLYYWFARSQSRQYSGIVSARGIVSFISVASSPTDRTA